MMKMQTAISSLQYVLILVAAMVAMVMTDGTEERGANGVDRLTLFYERISKPDAKYCEDKTRLLPHCNMCIPGLQQGPNSLTCNEFIQSSKGIRDEIKRLTDSRYGHNPVPDRPFGLYPYLERPDFMSRQLTFGKMLSAKPQLSTVIDIGAYYNPIHLFFAQHVCPNTIIVIEPILDPLSVSVPCSGPKNEGSVTYIHFLPVTFKHYMGIMDILQEQSVAKPETVVCIGCDSHYGPNRKMLETAFPRPYALYIEYPSEYIHNTPFKKMNGEGMGEEMTFIHKFQPKTNETQYTKRVMKVIEYQ